MMRTMILEMIQMVEALKNECDGTIDVLGAREDHSHIATAKTPHPSNYSFKKKH